MVSRTRAYVHQSAVHAVLARPWCPHCAVSTLPLSIRLATPSNLSRAEDLASSLMHEGRRTIRASRPGRGGQRGLAAEQQCISVTLNVSEPEDSCQPSQSCPLQVPHVLGQAVFTCTQQRSDAFKLPGVAPSWHLHLDSKRDNREHRCIPTLVPQVHKR